MKFSVVLPVHDEEVYLPYSLPSIFALEPSELVVVFDRCRDHSVEVVDDLVRQAGFEPARVKYVEVSERFDGFQLNGVRRRGYEVAENNVILATGADIILDHTCMRALDFLEEQNVALVSLGCLDYPVSPRNLVGNLAQKFMANIRAPRFYGPFFFKRNLLRNLTEVSGFISEDAPLWLALLDKFEMRFVHCCCLHLRGDESWQRNYWRGRDYWRVARRNPVFALASSVLMFRPSLMVGYLHERVNSSG